MAIAFVSLCGGVLGGVILGFLMVWDTRRKLNRLRAAAMAVLTDWRERDECYPGWYRQPALMKVMSNLVDAVRETL
jgi:hypothetical protein